MTCEQPGYLTFHEKPVEFDLELELCYRWDIAVLIECDPSLWVSVTPFLIATGRDIPGETRSVNTLGLMLRGCELCRKFT